jgi:AraC-like DNA-binding protein
LGIYINRRLVGLSVIEQAARAFGLVAATEKYGSRLFANDATLNLVLTTAATIKPETKSVMRKQWEELQSGANQHRVAILDNDLKVSRLALAADEAQFLSTRNPAMCTGTRNMAQMSDRCDGEMLTIFAGADDESMTLVERVASRKTAWKLEKLASVLGCSRGKLYTMGNTGRMPYINIWRDDSLPPQSHCGVAAGARIHRAIPL